MKLIIDPRRGDIDDDACSTKRRSLLAITGALLAEMSFLKLAVAWTMLIVIPALLLGLAPVAASAWLTVISGKLASALTAISAVVLLLMSILAWLAGRPLFRLAETNFWSLNSLVVQPMYAFCREAFGHAAERFLSSQATPGQRAALRATTAAAAGLGICGVATMLIFVAWPSSHWIGNVADFVAPHRLFVPALANSTVIVASYLAVMTLIWGISDARMAQPQDLDAPVARTDAGPFWRVAHLSDLHVVGERYGFRIESGRSGPQGNARLKNALAQLNASDAEDPLDVILITGDMTDSGRSTEWAEFLDALALFPRLAARMLALPGNHDLNVVDRANPARLELPTSSGKRLRQARALSILAAVQGERVRVIDHSAGRLGGTLAQALAPYFDDLIAFADSGTLRLSRTVAKLWADAFPMISLPDADDGLGVILLNSNAETHFSFTNALGLVSAEQARGIEIACAHYRRAKWIVALHHHVIEYPKPATAFSERIGTALINGSWFTRRLQRFGDRIIVMHGHRHIDWIGDCGGLVIVSAPSPVMEATDEQATYFHIHTVAAGSDRRVRLFSRECIRLAGQASADNLVGSDETSSW